MQHSARQLSNPEKFNHRCQRRLISVGGSGGFHLCHSRCTVWLGHTCSKWKDNVSGQVVNYLCTWPENHVSRKLLSVCFHLLYKRYWEAWPSSLCFCCLSPYYAHLFMCTLKIVNASVKIIYRVPHLHLHYWRKKQNRKIRGNERIEVGNSLRASREIRSGFIHKSEKSVID